MGATGGSDAERRTVPSVLRTALVAVLLVPVHLWRATAVLRQPRCRFHPSCSTYALEALRVHGPVHGTGLAVRRLGRCHPWNPGGVDHVPPPAHATVRGADPAVRSPR